MRERAPPPQWFRDGFNVGSLARSFPGSHCLGNSIQQELISYSVCYERFLPSLKEWLPEEKYKELLVAIASVREL